jgi:hypothetical protein
MLDVAIGLILVFLLVSLICTALAEVIEGVLRQRAAHLQQGIRELLQDRDGIGLSKKFYEHPLIAGLYPGDYQQQKSRNLPSYIPSRLFALVMIDLIQTNDATVAHNTDEQENKKLQTQKETIESVINKLVKVTGADMNLTIAEIENWFNGSMDRIAGWYKRKVQKILIALGLVVAITMNIDTISVFKSLVNDADLRNSLVSAAQEYAKPTARDIDTSSQSAVKRLELNNKKLRELRLPIGWDWDKPAELDNDPKYVTNYHLAIPEGKRWIFKVLGWLMTALAVSLGSAFWFDVLNKVMVIRSTVKPHEKSVEEASEDRQVRKSR